MGLPATIGDLDFVSDDNSVNSILYKALLEKEKVEKAKELRTLELKSNDLRGELGIGEKYNRIEIDKVLFNSKTSLVKILSGLDTIDETTILKEAGKLYAILKMGSKEVRNILDSQEKLSLNDPRSEELETEYESTHEKKSILSKMWMLLPMKYRKVILDEYKL